MPSSEHGPAGASEWHCGAGGALVHARTLVPPAPRAAVLLLHGYSEHVGSYGSVMRALARRGFAVSGPDHRGHGRTATVLGDLASFDAVLDDVGDLYARIGQRVPGVPVFVLAHSLGALIAIRFLARARPPVAGVVLNGAAIAVPAQIPRALVEASRVLGRLVPLAPVHGFFDPSRATRDPEVQRALAADPLRYKRAIRARTGLQVLAAIEAVQQELGSVRVPVLLTHGTDDPTVPVAESRRLARAWGHPDCSVHLFPGLRHEVHREPEREQVFATWTDWMEART